MHSRKDLRSRMPTVPITTANHLVMVRWMDGQWFYDNNSSYVPFIPRDDDRLIARVDLNTRKVTMLRGLDTAYQGVAAGYLQSDLVVTPNVFGTNPNFGEFGLQGTYIQFE
jgi:hypothetical protein